MEIAKQNSVNIKAAESLADAQKRFANQQKYWSNPTASYSSNFGNSEFSVSQTLPFYGKLQSRYDIENAEFGVLTNRRKITELFVQSDLFVLLYQYHGLQQKIDLAQKRLTRLAILNRFLSSLILNSPTKQTQAQITKDHIKLVERDLVKYRNQLYQTWNLANVYLHLPSQPDGIQVKWLDTQSYKGRKFFVDAAIENNLDLQEQKLLIQKAKSELSYAKIEQMPDVNISASKQNNSSAQNLGNQDSSALGLSLSVPLINLNKEKIAGSSAKIRSQQQALEFRTNQLMSEINNDLNGYETALNLAKMFPTSQINITISRLNRTNEDFKKGLLDFLTYIELDTKEYEVIDAIINTQIELASSYANLMTKVGAFTLPQ